MTHVHKASIALTLVCVAATVAAQAPAPTPAQPSVEVVRVTSKAVERQVKLPGEFQPYLAVPIYAKLPGFVKRVAVDRGSSVKQGQVLVTLEAPEMLAQIAEAQSKAQAVGLQRAEAEAKLAAAQSTYDRLKAAAATPGVVAENDVVVAQKTAEAAQALVRSYADSIKAAEAQVQAVKDLEHYLTLKAPFDGIITERNVHPGALVGPGTGSPPLVRLHQISRLRLVVAVPEALVGAMVKGARVPFTVPAYPGETFHGVLSLIAYDLDEKTRTMPVELDVRNADLRLGAGMYPEVQWPVRRPQPSLLVPPTSIATTTERTFVIRVNNGVAQWVNVSRGARVGDLVEVFGALKEGDTIVRRGTDEIREGSKVNVQPEKATS
ncbi:MAG TPA: efflux RND transporter periplasmic adaptor subunit [Vicinamibacterales bacterium]|nr:efflux RND transporter periplasmic adaptor subunit [Vicinamibacterales bacterium]